MRTTDKTPLLSNATYDRLMNAALVILPAAAALYFAVATLWGFPEPDRVLGTIASIEIFLGAMLKLSKRQYNNSDAKYDGALIEVPIEGGKTFVLEPREDRGDIGKKDEVLFKVVSE